MAGLSYLQADEVLYFIADRFIENNEKYTEEDVDRIYDKLLNYGLLEAIEDALEYVVKS